MMYDLPPALASIENKLRSYCQWEYHEVFTGEERFYLALITNTENLLDRLISKGDEHEDVIDEKIPYWADVWPSSIGMGQYILQMGGDWNGQSAIEIGCGLGLAGMAAYKRGMELIMTDYLEEPLDFVKVLWWRNFGENVRTIKMDWREPLTELASDLVIASDVVYEKQAYEHVLNTFELLIKAGGRGLLSEPQRTYSKAFLPLLEEKGFNSKKIIEQIQYQEEFFEVDVYELLHTVS